MSVNLSVVHHCLMASSTVVASCRWVMISKTCSRSLTPTYNINWTCRTDVLINALIIARLTRLKKINRSTALVIKFTDVEHGIHTSAMTDHTGCTCSWQHNPLWMDCDHLAFYQSPGYTYNQSINQSLFESGTSSNHMYNLLPQIFYTTVRQGGLVA